MTSLGIAMLARNAANQIPHVIKPFRNHVDQVAIVLGGLSGDDTPAVAERWADKVIDYEGPLDEGGRLMDFGAARQQSFDLLKTDWALVVDCDDIWQGQQHTRIIVDKAEEVGAVRVIVPYHLGDATFAQPRFYRREAGYWTSPVHNLWLPRNGNDYTLTVDAMTVRQVKGDDDHQERIKQSIAIAERHLAEHTDTRLLSHLAKDYMLAKRYDKAVETYDRYLQVVDPETEKIDPLFYAYFNRGMCLLANGDTEGAYSAALAALSVANYGLAWALLADASYQIGSKSRNGTAFYEMSLNAAEMALKTGKARSLYFPTNIYNVTSVPYHLKAKVLSVLGRKQEALSAIDLGLRLRPGDMEMLQLKRSLCEELGVTP